LRFKCILENGSDLTPTLSLKEKGTGDEVVLGSFSNKNLPNILLPKIANEQEIIL
jgi:hypothetical protein